MCKLLYYYFCDQYIKEQKQNFGKKVFAILREHNTDVFNIYFYAIISGIVYLSLPLGIQSILNYALGATMVFSIYLLIGLVTLGTWLVGFFRVKVMEIIEKIQQKIFVEYTMRMTDKITKIDLKNTDNYYLPELLNRFFDIQNLQKGISKILLDIPASIIQIIFGIILLSFYHYTFLIFGAFILLLVVLLFRLTKDKGIETSLAESDAKYEVSAWLEDVGASVKTFKTTSRLNTHISVADEKTQEYIRHRTDHFRVLVFQYKSIIFFKVLITLIMLLLGTYLLVEQKLSIGSFVATEIVMLSIIAGVENLIKNLESYYDIVPQ